jgi:hypothetical protein
MTVLPMTLLVAMAMGFTSLAGAGSAAASTAGIAATPAAPVCTRARVVPVLRAAALPGERLRFRTSPLLCGGRWAFMEPIVNHEFGIHTYARWRVNAWHNVSRINACRHPARLPRLIAQTCRTE